MNKNKRTRRKVVPLPTPAWQAAIEERSATIQRTREARVSAMQSNLISTGFIIDTDPLSLSSGRPHP